MSKPAFIFDGRRIINPFQLSSIGFTVEQIGLPSFIKPIHPVPIISNSGYALTEKFSKFNISDSAKSSTNTQDNSENFGNSSSVLIR